MNILVLPDQVKKLSAISKGILALSTLCKLTYKIQISIALEFTIPENHSECCHRSSPAKVIGCCLEYR